MFVRKPRALDAVEGDPIIIECEVAGDPKPLVYWQRDWIKVSERENLSCCLGFGSVSR